ncbi:hypothetical protein DIPPA_07948 [Diplonema papillatum]|nr:hypothetical protein DIPPA_07948 [Diplonema papillatum]
MSGEYAGVRNLVTLEDAPFMLWAWCSGHCLNLACGDMSVMEHGIVCMSRRMIADTYTVLYKGKGNGSRKLRTFHEATKAVTQLNNLTYWQELEVSHHHEHIAAHATGERMP